METERFTSEVVPLGKKLYRFALGFLRDESDAEDAVQEVLIKLWDRRASLERYRSLEAFAMTVTRNHCLDKLRGRHTLSLEGFPAATQRERTEKTPQEKLEVTDQVGMLRQIMEGLPVQQKEILQLRDVEGYEFEEISGITGMNINLIRVNLSRARKKIRETMINRNQYGTETNKNLAGKVLRG